MAGILYDAIMTLVPGKGRNEEGFRLDAGPYALVVLVKKIRDGNDRYVFVYEDIVENRAEALRTLGRFASNPELSFKWPDTIILKDTIDCRNKHHELSERLRG
jgi:hypothetical protein